MNNQFRCDWDTYAKALFTRAVEKNIAVIGVTDYFSIDGYKKIRAYQDDEPKLRRLLKAELVSQPKLLESVKHLGILANVELRLTNLVPTKDDGKHRRVNFHVIFSEEVDPQDIEENFLGRLAFVTEGSPNAKDDTKTLTRSNIEKLGRRLKGEQGFSGSDFEVGCTHVAVSHEAVTDLLENQRGTFSGRYALVLPDEDIQRVSFMGQGHLTRKILYQKTHFFFTANPDTREHLLSESFATEFGERKPCIWGSDAHSLDRLFEVDLERYCWIKADRTFTGLLQVTNEPADRVFIGPEPPTVSSMRERRRQYIQRISIRRRDSEFPERWFDGTQLELNPELIAIIGRKGSGKSALADIIALIGHSTASADDFSFLNDARFRKPDGPGKVSRASHFEASATWSNREVVGPVRLDAHAAGDQVERVKYLPQGYIEKVCASKVASSSDLFEKELNRVIFSNIPVEDQRGFRDLDSLIDDETSEVKRRLSRLKADVRGLNVQILQIEQRLQPENRERLQKLIASKTNDLQAVSDAPPPVVPEPSTDAATRDTITASLERLQKAQSEARILTGQINVTLSGLAILRRRLSGLAKLDQRLDEIDAIHKSLSRDFSMVAADVGLDLANLVRIQIDRALLTSTIRSLQATELGLLARLDVKQEQSLATQLREREKDAALAQASLDEPNRRYQVYRSEVLAWEKHKAEIVGDAETFGTLMFLQQQLKEIDEVLPDELAALKTRRDEAMLAVFAAIMQQAEIYRRYYARVQEALHERVEHAKVGLKFNVAIATDALAEGVFAMISQNVAGTFCGVEEGRRQLSKIVRDHPFDSSESVLGFASAMMLALSFDLRYSSAPPVTWERSLKGRVEPKQVLDFLFSLEFLEPKYELRMEGRALQELSPGERGLLLLFFYLAVDRDTKPLILDQPDENLDNESINETLVPLILGAKKRRQIIVVTHNPNLAVVCDAEQVIFAKLEPSQAHLIQYDPGSIENPIINKHIVDVLEGTPPAFRNRQRKYTIVGSL